MPGYIVKINPNDDLYIYWSTITDCPHFCGTRAELSNYLDEIHVNSPERWKRADTYGTSAQVSGVDKTFRFYAWDETEFITESRGLVKRSDLPELTRCLAENKPYPHILHPFEDGHIRGWDS